MRVCVTRSALGEVDGIQLATFQVGMTDDVPALLATYLITSGLADPVMDHAPALVVPLDEVRVAVNVEPIAVAADTGAPATGAPASRTPATLAADRGSTP